MNILVVDDETEIADLIEHYLKNEGYKVFKYYNSIKAMERINQGDIDLAILDVMMPDIDGFEMCFKIREKYNFPIIFVTAKVEDINKIEGLGLGADDYVTKPFTPLELVARVKAQLRRYTKYNEKEDKDIVEIRELTINNSTHECFFNNNLLNFTPTEFSILWNLCKNKGNVLTAEELTKKVWKGNYLESNNNTIMVHIRHIREKMNDLNNPKYIKTVWGVGYKIE